MTSPGELAGVPEAESLSEYLHRPLTPVNPAVLQAIADGPVAHQLALPLTDVDRLLDPKPLAVESGWCHMPDATGYVAIRTPMPHVTGEMVDWWFDWHPRESLRYRAWHPQAHMANSLQEPAVHGVKAHWGTVHFPVEDVGTGTVRARIAFLPPSKFGFSSDALADPNVATIVCGQVGDLQRRSTHSLMAHVWLNEGSGTVLRSHFWLGPIMRPDLPGALGDAIGNLINRPSIRRRIMPADLPKGLATHCAEEYTHLAAILPGLHAEFS